MLPLCLIHEALEFYNSIPAGEVGDIDDTFEKIKGRFWPDSFKMVIRERFFSERQTEDKPVT